MKLSVIIPAYNEADIIEEGLKTLVTAGFQNYEIVVVENGSSDDTAKIVSRLAKKHPEIRLVQLEVASFGGAIREGVRVSKGEHVVLLNADWIDTDFIHATTKLLSSHDIVVGSKVLDKHLDHRPFVRKVLSFILTAVLKRVFGFNLSDSHGLKAWRSGQNKLWLMTQQNEIIETEFLLRAMHAQSTMTEVAVQIEEHRAPRISIVKRGGHNAQRTQETLCHQIAALVSISLVDFHADDMGRDEKVVAACRELADQNLLRSFSVMANGSDIAGALKLHHDFPELPVSLHFDIVNGHAKAGKSSLTRMSGVFRLPLKEPQGFVFQLIRMLFFGVYTLCVYRSRDIAHELEAQYEFLTKAGFRITGIDAEQHLHAYEPAAHIFTQFAAQKSLKIRLLGDWQPQGSWPQKKLKLLALSAQFSSLVRRRKLTLPATWGSQDDPYVVASWEQIDISKVPVGTFIECHPGTEFDVKLWDQLRSSNTK